MTVVVLPPPARVAEPLRPAGVEEPPRLEPAPAPVERLKPASRGPVPAPVEPAKPASREPAPAPVEPLKPASREPAPAPVEERAKPPGAEPPRTLETCEIAFWRGYATGQFYAAGVAPGVRRPYAVAVSPSFRVRRGDGVPETQAATAALEALVKTLLEAGWTPQGRGDEWYVHRFARRTSGRGAAAPTTPRTAFPT